MQGFEMAESMLYLSFLKPFLPDFFSTLPTLTPWDLPQFSFNQRQTQVLKSPHYPTSPSVHDGVCGSAPLIHNDHEV